MLHRLANTIGLLLILSTSPALAQEVLRSTKHPITVHYAGAAQLTFAKSVLVAAEEAWGFHVDGLKLPAPPPDAGGRGSDDYDFVITKTPYLGICKGYAKAPTTAHGLMSFIELDPSLPAGLLPLITSHEFHHAVQGGICPIGDNLGEAGALYASGLHRKGQGWWLSYFLGINEFQAYPERALDWQGELGDFYPYGGGLFLMFLDQAYGDGPAGSVLTKLYTRLIEEGKSQLLGCPGYLQLLRGLYDLDAAFKKFCRWRWFVGPNDDGLHIKDLADWENKPGWERKLTGPRLAAELGVRDLPVRDARPEAGPMTYGASFIRLDLAGLPADARLRISVAGEAGVRWSVQTLLLGATPAVEQEHQTGIDGKAALEVETKGSQSLVLIVANLGDGKIGQQGAGWVAKSFSYSIQRVQPPIIASVEPGLVTAGTETTLSVHGKSFPEGDPQVKLSVPEVTASAARRVSAELVEVTIYVAESAAAGPVDLELGWATSSARLAGAFTLEAIQPPEESEPPPSSGCSLSTHRRAPIGPMALLLLGLGLVLAVRPRAQGAGGDSEGPGRTSRSSSTATESTTASPTD